MNIGVVMPEEGYLEAVRDITKRHGVVLIFDEVKTGLAIAAGGATERFGVQPDMVTLAKTLGGGLPSGAIGGTEEAMSVVEDGSVYQVGTFNGNPLTMAAARASLFDVLTPGGLRASRPDQRQAARGLPGRDRPPRLPRLHRGHRQQGLRHVLRREGHRLRDLQAQHRRGAHGPGLAVQPEPRDLHDARPRGGVDALDRAHGRGGGRLHRGLPGARRRISPARISVTVSPGAARTELVGRHGDGWKARIAAPPERGRANQALVELLAAALDVAPSSVRVVAGQRGRAKVVEIDALDRAEVVRRLERKVRSSP